MRHQNEEQAHGPSGLVPGLIVAGVGVLFLLNNLNIFYFREVWKFWPLILIAIGATKLIDSPHTNEKGAGAILAVVGGIFLAANLGAISWRVWQLWPLILIGAGILMLLNRTNPGLLGGIRIRTGRPVSRADAVAIFGGFKRRVSTDDYRGANYVAICGGGEIDLRQAHILGDGAQIDIVALFGGFEIRVPTSWIVVNEMVGIFGGTSDETQQPLPEASGTRRLTVRGMAMFGGVAIKN